MGKNSILKNMASVTATTKRKPTILIPYESYFEDENSQDIFVYLRPQTNGIRAESCMMRVIAVDDHYREHVKLAYLANIPGSVLREGETVRRHYGVRDFFARHGKDVFTSHMENAFELFYDTDFDEAKIIGAYDALTELNMTKEELFRIWVPSEDVLIINGQIIKQYNDYYIVNYDIPAILNMNDDNTDIACMILRTDLSYIDLHHLFDKMAVSLREQNMIKNKRTFSRAFHYSKSPFEQILDGMGYLYKTPEEHVPMESIRFCHYCIQRGIGTEQILGLIRNPIMTFQIAENVHMEEDLFSITIDNSYEEAFSRLQSSCSQYLIRD